MNRWQVSAGEGHSAGVPGTVVERAALAREPGPLGGTALPGLPIHAGGCRAAALVSAPAGAGALQGLQHPRGRAEAAALGRCEHRAAQREGAALQIHQSEGGVH